jgi:hypothetical protein
MRNVETVYLIHHSHTDIGYTHDQPIVWDLHGRFLDEAVRLADQYAGSDADSAFRWTVENTGVLYEWLKHAPASQVERFVALEKAGRIEVTGMFANLTPLLDTGQLIESLQLVGKLREQYGFTIAHAMNCDVNGESWSLVDLLADAGIEGFSMAINIHFGGAPLNRPDVFWWEGPSGRKIMALNGWTYDTGWRFGIGHDATLLEEWWPRIQQRLDEINYPLPVLMMQSFHPFGDNGPAYEGFSTFIEEWNAQGKTPRLVMATPRMWWDAVKQHSHLLPTHRGDWTDFWNFGSISSAREQATNRNSRTRLRAADAAATATLGLAKPLPTAHLARTMAQYREEAWKALNLWDEHTWGADLSLRAPESEDTVTQWHHKAHYAYLARSLSQMLQRDAVADFARHVQRENADDLLLFNPLPWPRTIFGEVAYHVVVPRGTPDDATAGRHSQDRVWSTDLYAEAAQTREGKAAQGRFGIPRVQVPGYGYTVIERAALVDLMPETFREAAVVANDRFRLVFDTQQGGLRSMFDKSLQRELYDAGAGYPLHGYVHEEVADKEHPWPRSLMFQMEWHSEQVERDRGWKPGWRANRRQPARVVTHRVYDTPFGQRVVQVLEAPGITGPLVQSVFLPNHEDYVEFESAWVMGQATHPEATYLMFPFDVPDAKTRIDLGGQPMIAGEEQIPGVCFDYYTAQQWVDFSNEEFGVTVALPDNPMVQFGDFHFGDNQSAFHAERAMLLGWVTNTYWETNFRTHQPGGVRTRYRVYPHQGHFDAAAAFRAGQETAAGLPLVQHMGEPADSQTYPAAGSLLRLPEQTTPQGAVVTLHVKPGRKENAVIARLYNTGDTTQTACIGSGLLRIEAAQVCDLFDNPLETLEVTGGDVSFRAPARRVTCLKLTVRLGQGQ